MKIYSLSFSILAVTVFGLFVSLPYLATYDKLGSPISNNVRTHVLKSKATGNLLAGLSGSYSGNGYHSYGTYTINVSSLPANSNFTIYWNTYTIPNRFTLRNGTNQTYTGWQGYATWPGPWGMNGINSQNSGSLSINKGTSSTIDLIVESSNSTPPSGDDNWDLTY